MTLTLNYIYEETTQQAWSIFDSEISTLEDDDAGVINSIRKALPILWNAYPYSFRLKEIDIETEKNESEYKKPAGNIKSIYLSNSNGKNEKLEYLHSPILESIIDKPTNYFIKKNKINLFPIPDNSYNLSVSYHKIKPARNISGEEINNLYELTDYINISEEYEEYEELFKNALITKAMLFAIASPQNRNYASYQEQADRAFKTLINVTSNSIDNKIIKW